MNARRRKINRLGTVTGIKAALLCLAAGALAARLWAPFFWVGVAASVFFLASAALWINYDPDKT